MSQSEHVPRRPVAHATTKLDEALSILEGLAAHGPSTNLRRAIRKVHEARSLLDQAIRIADTPPTDKR